MCLMGRKVGAFLSPEYLVCSTESLKCERLLPQIILPRDGSRKRPQICLYCAVASSRVSREPL